MAENKFNSICIFNKKNPTVILDLNKLFNDSKNIIGYSSLEITNIPDNYKDYLSTHLYINGLRYDEYLKEYTYTEEIYDEYTQETSVATYTNTIIAAVESFSRHIYTLYIDEFNNEYEFNFSAKIKLNTKIPEEEREYDIMLCHINNADYIEDFETFGVDNKSKSSAFMVLRTNPKLTGNIKLVVSDNDLYLDTFKKDTHKSLSYKRYRKQPVQTDGNYAMDLFTVFKSLSPNVLMDVDDVLYQSAYTIQDLNDQYATQYEYGAETNNDSLYTEHFKILAPLHIGNNLPDYFIIFKREENQDTNDFNIITSESKICKIFDLRTSTNIGSYINKWTNIVQEQGLSNVCYTDFDLNNDTNIPYKNYADRWQGISYKSGSLTTKELTRFKNINSYKQEDINLYYLNGFQNLGLIYPNILNLEFMFDDDTISDFSTAHYFGLYVTENVFKTLTNVIKPELSSTDKLQLFSYNPTVNIMDDIKDTLQETVINQKVLTGLSTSDNIFVLNKENASAYNNTNISWEQFLIDQVADIPGKDIANPECKKIDIFDFNSFLTITFDHTINSGEHFRFIAEDLQNNKIQIFEIIASNDERLTKFSIHPVSPYINTNHFSNNDGIDIEFYTMTFYTDDIAHSLPITLEEQLQRIKYCIKKFNSFITLYSSNTNTISICSLKSNIIFQHINPNNYDDAHDYLHYFNYSHYTPVYDVHTTELPVLSDDDNVYTTVFNNPVYNTNETRYSSVAKFISINLLKGFNIYEIDANIDSILETVKIPLYYGNDGKYKPLAPINAEQNINALYDKDTDYTDITSSSVYTLTSPYDVNKSLIYMLETPMITGNKIKIYDQPHVDLSILSMIPIKDLNSKLDESLSNPKIVNDTVNYYNDTILDFKHHDSLKKFELYEIKSGSITCYNIADNANNILKNYYISPGQKFMFISDNAFIIYDNGTNDFMQYNFNNIMNIVSGTIIKKLDYNAFIKMGKSGNCIMSSVNLFNSDKKLNIPICPPLNIAWETTGDYYDHDCSVDVKSMFNFKQKYISGNFIEAGSDFHMTSDILHRINNTDISVKDYILQTGRIKKFYSDIPTAIGHYNTNSEVLEFIYNGLQFELQFNNTSLSNSSIFLSNFDNCEICIVNEFNPSLNNEIYISEVDNFILILNHQYKGDSSKLTCNNIKYLNKDNKFTYADYYWQNAPYQYEMSSVMYQDGYFYLQKSENYELNDKTAITFIQPGYTIYQHETSYDNETAFYSYFDLGFTNHGKNKYFDIVSSAIHMTNFYKLNTHKPEYKAEQIFSKTLYNYFLESQLYDGHDLGSSFIENENDGILAYDVVEKRDNRFYTPFILYDLNRYDRSYDFDNLIVWAKQLLNTPLSIYIINESGYQEMIADMDDTNNILVINGPINNSKYCAGYIKPEFIDMIEFDNIQAHNIELKTNMDLSLANVCPAVVKTITSYPYRNIQRKQLSVNNGNYRFKEKNILQNVKLNELLFQNRKASAISYKKDQVNYAAKLEENSYMMRPNVKLEKQIDNVLINPITNLYNQFILNMKSFFGSLCIQIPNEPIDITDYSNHMQSNIIIKPGKHTHNILPNGKQSAALKTFDVSINLSNLIIGYFNKHDKFMSNWNIKNDTIINNFIKQYLMRFYNLTKTEITVYQKIISSRNKTTSPRCIVGQESINSINNNYTIVNNLNITYNTDKTGSLIATFNITVTSDIAIYPVIKIIRQ